MRKIIIFFCGFMIIIFILPIIFINQRTKSVDNLKNNVGVDGSVYPIEIYNYSEYSKIKLLHAKTNEVEEVNLDEYIASVVSA